MGTRNTIYKSEQGSKERRVQLSIDNCKKTRCKILINTLNISNKILKNDVNRCDIFTESFKDNSVDKTQNSKKDNKEQSRKSKDKH